MSIQGETGWKAARHEESDLGGGFHDGAVGEIARGRWPVEQG